jgi:cysteine synthase A
MQGWTPDFIPKLTGDAVDLGLADHLMPIPGPEAIKCSQDLAQKEGIFVGITAGATFVGALKIAANAPKGTNILAMMPDTGERYLSTPLFADVPSDMTEDEQAIFRSTPMFTEPATA